MTGGEERMIGIGHESNLRGMRMESQSGGRFARGLASCAESNRVVVNPRLHDWCFRLTQQARSLIKGRGRIEGAMRRSCGLKRMFR